jgi:dolichol kinase
VDFGVRLTRRRCERALLLASAAWVVDRLGRELGEVQVALELGVIIVLTMAYLEFRTIDNSSSGPGPETKRRGSGEAGVAGAGGNNNHNGGNLKARSGVVLQHGPSLTNREKRNSMSGGPVSGAIGSGLAGTSTGTTSKAGSNEPGPLDAEDYRPGSVGTVWATEPKDYRDCLDDGAAWALLLGPILSGSMFYETCTRLRGMYSAGANNLPAGTATNGWQIEAPLVSPSTRPFIVAGQGPASAEQAESQAVLAISALAYSRKQACHLMCLLSLLLLAHTLWSCRRHLLMVASSHESQVSGGSNTSLPPWSKRSEWRRTGAVVAFSFVLTAGFVVLKVAAQVAGVVGGYGKQVFGAIMYGFSFR